MPRGKDRALGMARWRDGLYEGRAPDDSEVCFLLGAGRPVDRSRRRRRRKIKRETTTIARNATLPTTDPIIAASGPVLELAPMLNAGDVDEDEEPPFVPGGGRTENEEEGVVVEERKGKADVGAGVEVEVEMEVREAEVVAPTFWMEEELVDDAPDSAMRCKLDSEMEDSIFCKTYHSQSEHNLA